jgi:hypothetical protein
MYAAACGNGIVISKSGLVLIKNRKMVASRIEKNPPIRSIVVSDENFIFANTF